MGLRRFIVAAVSACVVFLACAWVLLAALGNVRRYLFPAVDTLVVFTAATGIALVASVFVALAVSRWSRERETRCRKCGYILRGITEPRCPECGERI